MDWRFVASLIQLDALRMQSPWRYGTCGMPPRMPASLGPPRLSSYPSSLGLFPLLQLPPSGGVSNPSIDGSGISGAFHPKPHSSLTSPTLASPGGGPAEMLFSLRDLEQKSSSSSSSSSSAVHLIKKPGRWCAAHVRIAWEIHLNQQIQPQRHSQATSSESTVKNNGQPANQQQRRPSLGPSPWTSPSAAGASSSSAAGGPSGGGLVGVPGPLGLDNGFRPTTPSTPSTGIPESVSAVAGPSRPTSRPPTLPGPLQSPSLFNFSSLLGPLNERSFAAQLEAIYKYGSVASPFVGLSPFRSSLGGLTGPTSGLFGGGLDGYLGGGGSGLFTPGAGGFSLSPVGSVGPTSASSELSRLGRTAVASSFGGSRPWLDQGAGGDKDRLENEAKERTGHHHDDNRTNDNCHRNHKHSRSDRDGSTYRRSSTSDRPISRDSSSHESNPSPAVIKTSLDRDRDRSRSPVSRNRPDSTVKLLGTSNRQNTEYQQQVPGGGGFGGSRGQGDRRTESGSPPPSLPPSLPVVREWEKVPPPPPPGLRANPESLRDFYRRDPMAMVDPVLVGLYSGLAGLTGQSFLGPFGIYGAGGGGGGRGGVQDAEREAGESTTRHGSESPVNRTKMDSGGSSSSSVKGERSEKKRKDHKDSKKCSPSKKHSGSVDGRLFHTAPDCSLTAVIDRGSKTPLTTMDDGELNPKGNHSPSSTVETSSASTPTVDAKTTGNNNNNNNAILNPLLPPYPTTEVGLGCSAASSGNVTPDSSSCDPLHQPQMEKSVMELEGSSSIVHTVVAQHLQEEC